MPHEGRVMGTRDVGSTVQDYPVGVSGVDGTGAVRALRTDANGELQVDVLSTPAPTLAAPGAAASGSVTAPAASAVIADSGAMAAGNYLVIVDLSSTGVAGVGKYMIVEHRNAGNTATLRSVIMAVPNTHRIEWPKLVLAANERIRVINSPTAGAASEVYAAMVTLIPVP